MYWCVWIFLGQMPFPFFDQQNQSNKDRIILKNFCQKVSNLHYQAIKHWPSRRFYLRVFRILTWVGVVSEQFHCLQVCFYYCHFFLISTYTHQVYWMKQSRWQISNCFLLQFDNVLTLHQHDIQIYCNLLFSTPFSALLLTRKASRV